MINPEFYWVAVVATTVLSTARITRLLNFDKFPPIKALRDRYEERYEGTGWEWLTMCGFCMSMWVILPIFALGWWAQVYGHDMSGGTGFTVWWIVNGIFAMAYLSGSYIARDGDDS